MMKIILKNKSSILQEIDLKQYEVDNIVFGSDLVKEILLEHDFKYGVVSEKKKGTTFYFVIKKFNKCK